MGLDNHGRAETGSGLRERSPLDLRLEEVSEGLMRVKEVEEFLGVSRAFVYAEMARGALPWAKLGRGRRVPRLAVLEYAASRIHACGVGRDLAPDGTPEKDDPYGSAVEHHKARNR